MTITDLMTGPSVTIPILGLLLWTSYLIIYRLYLSPIAKFPGPKLAALTRWYEFYYEVILQGQFTFHIDHLDNIYGPIVRITPEELHIKDSDYWEEFYQKNIKADKYEWFAGRFGHIESIFTTPNYAVHRIRRGALNPMYMSSASLMPAGDFALRSVEVFKTTNRGFPAGYS
ncbi:MAG: hypothetical protein M1816_000973 [Peltula sp. TS41687]|nr:MAG: hypothetical protein M1816_000973 [Peltula sp. TS41687]